MREGYAGGHWQERQRAGLRHSYRAGVSRGGAVSVSGEFFDLLRNETCDRWLEHLAEQADLGEHLRARPAWIADLPVGRMGRDDAAGVAAEVLGISVRSVYRGMGSRGQA